LLQTEPEDKQTRLIAEGPSNMTSSREFVYDDPNDPDRAFFAG